MLFNSYSLDGILADDQLHSTDNHYRSQHNQTQSHTHSNSLSAAGDTELLKNG